MLMRADILLLDEPTNHLDVANVAWLENYLVNRPEISSVSAFVLGLVCFLAGKLPGQPPQNRTLTLPGPGPHSECLRRCRPLQMIVPHDSGFICAPTGQPADCLFPSFPSLCTDDCVARLRLPGQCLHRHHPLREPQAGALPRQPVRVCQGTLWSLLLEDHTQLFPFVQSLSRCAVRCSPFVVFILKVSLSRCAVRCARCASRSLRKPPVLVWCYAPFVLCVAAGTAQAGAPPQALPEAFTSCTPTDRLALLSAALLFPSLQFKLEAKTH